MANNKNNSNNKKVIVDLLERPLIDLNPPIPALPKFPDKTKINIRYMLISPYVSVHIFWNQAINELMYEIEEPLLTKEEKEQLIRLEEGMRELVNVNMLIEKNQDAILDYIDKTAKLLLAELGIKLSKESYSRIFYYLYRDFIGLDEVEPLFRDYFIEDIECNGLNTPIYIIHRIYRNMRSNIVYKEIDNLAGFVEKLAQRCGRYISYASPLLDGSLPDGSRVQATYTTEITSRGPTFTIRKFTKVPWTPTQLIMFNTLSPEMLAYFWILLQYKCNILITGGTASGKTTLLNAIAFFIPPEARVVSIEDTRE
ncbi:MAG: secretion system protein E, partial [Bacteroidetes bacterium CG_4_10_14_3_um_filter_42_6]